MPPALSTLLTGGEADDNAYSYGNGERSYGSGQSGYDNNSFKFVCINNNNNTVVVVNETISEPPDTITCEECFEENVQQEPLASLNARSAAGVVTIVIGGEEIRPLSLTELCTVLQNATANEVLSFLTSQVGIDTDEAENFLVCLEQVFDFTTIGL